MTHIFLREVTSILVKTGDISEKENKQLLLLSYYRLYDLLMQITKSDYIIKSPLLFKLYSFTDISGRLDYITS